LWAGASIESRRNNLLVVLRKYGTLIGAFFLAAIPFIAYFFGKREGKKKGEQIAKKAEAKVEAVERQQEEAVQNEVEYRQDVKEAKESAEQAEKDEKREDSDNSFTNPNW